MSSTTTRLGLYKPAGDENVNVVTDLNENLDKVDLAVGFQVVTSGTRPSTPYAGKAIAESDNSYRSYFHNGTTPASSGWVEVLNSSGTFGSTVKVTTSGVSAATLATTADGSASTGVLLINPSSTNKRAVDIRLAGDVVSRLRVDMSGGGGAGTITFGDGTSVDTNLYRSGANELKTDDKFVVGGGVVTLSTASPAPSVNPASGAILYSESGSLKWRGTSGAAHDLYEQHGTGDIALSSAATGTLAVTFPTAFTSAPLVMVTIESPGSSTVDYCHKIRNLSTTGFTAVIRERSNSTVTETVTVHWRATNR